MWRNIASIEWNAEKDQWNTEKVLRVNRGMWRKGISVLDLYLLSVRPGLQASYDLHLSPYYTERPKWFPN
jgi:hypothetical protein